MFYITASYISFSSLKQKQDNANVSGSTKALEDELTCSVCLEQVNAGDLIRSLPCLHQVRSHQLVKVPNLNRNCLHAKFPGEVLICIES